MDFWIEIRLTDTTDLRRAVRSRISDELFYSPKSVISTGKLLQDGIFKFPFIPLPFEGWLSAVVIALALSQ